MPDGLARTSAAELTRFLMAWIRGGALGNVRILRADTVRQVFSDQHAQSTEHNVIQGLGWYREQDIWEHHGGDPGVSAYLGFRPSDGRGIVVLANRSDAHTQIAARVLDRVGLDTHVWAP